jgi:HD-GYP domain-containing protein (c-di-GMP phosphodiesterase class II)
VAARLRHGGEAFRLGGDEFAVLLPGAGTSQALAAAEAIVARVAAIRGDDGYSVTVSAGVATYPSPGVMQDELVRAADTALYWAKEHGKNRVRAHRGEADDLRELRGEAVPADRAARHRAALSLARAVEARDALAGGHAERVSALAARIAVRLGLDPEEVELVRLAGSLHDVGKLGLPPELLRKDTPLTAAERAAVERHAQIGFRMLESLGLTAVALAVLHHHERWDGGGYPDGLARAEIPLAARILCVADAFDAMTAHATYRPTVDAEDALAELQRCAGTQFDPAVVAALRAEVAAAPEPALAV